MVTASQAVRMYELFNKHFKNGEDAKVLVQEIEVVIDGKFAAERDRLASKSDLFFVKSDLQNAMGEVRKEVNEVRKEVNEVRKEINRVETRMEQGFKDQLRWLIGIIIGLASLGIAVLKFF